ncbi:hypothetical protein DE4585_01490 [Mycobacteroides salmoniphilum]|uniref:Uncharacterized protein n=1 Tax=Mycobacteroides salmoniphilum TaxID=404941 RepID=A0A4R8S2N7_9MYCO|nr:hypothetical protein DE4585_01490 [Mycobacteroides salmoniphilum]
MLTHRPANNNHAPNFNRSATAPEIRATVMIANINWKATNTVAGIVPTRGMFTAATASTALAGSAATASAPLPPIRPLSPKNCNGSPNKPDTSLPNAIEYPYSTHSTVTRPIALMLIMIMLSTFFARTMPP